MNRNTIFGLLSTVAVLLALASVVCAQSSPNTTIENTYWGGVHSRNDAFILEFQPGGKLRYIPETGNVAEGTWKLVGDSLDALVGDGQILIQAKLESRRFVGYAIDQDGQRSDWSAAELPAVTSSFAPIFPPVARAAHASSNVVVEVDIDPMGSVSSARVLSGHPMLKAVALNAANQWKFSQSQQDPVRTVRLCFAFRYPPNDLGIDKIKTPVYWSPYQIEIVAIPDRIM